MPEFEMYDPDGSFAGILRLPEGAQICPLCRGATHDRAGNYCWECGGDGYIYPADHRRKCIECGERTGNIAHGYPMCRQCAGHQYPTPNDPDMYDGRLL